MYVLDFSICASNSISAAVFYCALARRMYMEFRSISNVIRDIYVRFNQASWGIMLNDMGM